MKYPLLNVSADLSEILLSYGCDSECISHVNKYIFVDKRILSLIYSSPSGVTLSGMFAMLKNVSSDDIEDALKSMMTREIIRIDSKRRYRYVKENDLSNLEAELLG